MKIFNWFAILIVLTFAVDRAGGFLLEKINRESQFRFAEMYNGGLDKDILIVGNSRGVNGFYVPEIETLTHKTAFNISYNGLRMDIARSLIEDYLRLNKHPETIIIEASMLTKAYPELLKEFKPFASPGSSIWNEMSIVYPEVAFSCKLSHVFRFNSELFMRSLYYFNRSDQNWINNGDINEATIESLKNYGGTTFELMPQLIHDINTINQVCKQNNIKLKLILTPYLPQYHQKLNNLESWILEINNKTEGLSVIDESDTIQGNQYFADWVHLNKTGSKKFIKYLFDQGFFE